MYGKDNLLDTRIAYKYGPFLSGANFRVFHVLCNPKSNQIKSNQITSITCLVLCLHFSYATDKNLVMSWWETSTGFHLIPFPLRGRERGGGGRGADAPVAMVTLRYLMEEESHDDRSPLLLEASASTALAAVPQSYPGETREPHLDTFFLSR